MAIQAIRGMNDILPAQSIYWQQIENHIRPLMQAYAYQQIHLPIVEKTELFKRSIGEATDIVEKEMYTFLDRNGDSLTLRPEGTAGCVRAGIEHGLFYNQIQRFWYSGPMFRHERPQKGRYRQFHHVGVEAFGMSGPEIEAELILMGARLWQALGVKEHVSLQLNSLGSSAERAAYREALITYFEKHKNHLDEDSQRRMQVNPLRILDSKNPDMHALISKAPRLADHLGSDSRQHFEQLQALLDAAKVSYELNPRLVRGLDYYNHTVFEWVTEQLGAQGTVCAGGRYDGLVEQLGGKATPAVGFALGVERLALLLEANEHVKQNESIDAYLIVAGESAKQHAVVLAESLRTKLPRLRLLTDCTGSGIKSQFKRADASGAKWALILGDEEIQANKISIKYLRTEEAQQTVTIEKLIELMRE